MRSSSGLRGLSSSEEVDEADVLQHLRGAVTREAILVGENREQRRDRVGREPAQRVLRRRAHPPALVGEQSSDRRRRLGADDVARRPARRARARTTRCRRGARRAPSRRRCPLRVPSVSTAAARTFGSGSHVSCDQRRLGEPGVRVRASVAPQKRTAGFQSRRSGTRRSSGLGRELLERGRDPRARAACRAAARRSRIVDRPVVADVAERADGGVGDRGGSASSRTRRTRPGTAGWCARPSRCSASDASPAAPLGARTAAHPPNEPASRSSARSARSPSAARAGGRTGTRPRTTATRQHHPRSRRRPRARRQQRGVRARPPLRSSSAASACPPSNEGSAPDSGVVATIRSMQLTCTWHRALWRRAEAAYGGGTVREHGPPTGAASARRADSGAWLRPAGAVSGR